MKLDEFSKRNSLNEKDEGKHNNGKTTGFDAVAKKAAEEYGSKEAGARVAGAVRNKMKADGKIEEATGDSKFDSMMGKISGNTTPQSVAGNAANRVASKTDSPPDSETIQALNKMMYDLHKAMQEADTLMRKLTNGN